MDEATYNNFAESWWPYIIAFVVGTIVFIRTYVGGNECESDNKIRDKLVIITGASGGMGRELARELAKRGGRVILTCRDVNKGAEAEKWIKKYVPNAAVVVKELDVSSFKSVRKFVENLSYEKVDILINNAGIMFHPYKITEDGVENTFATNYLGHFLLTHLLVPKLEASENGRVINIASQAYAAGNINFNDINLENLGSDQLLAAFTQSKLAIVLMTRYMAPLLEDKNITINAANPGLVRNTSHMKYSPLKSSIPVRLSVWPWMWLFLKTPRQGIQTALRLAVDHQLSKTTGKFFSDCEEKNINDKCLDTDIDTRLYQLSCSMTNIQPGFKIKQR